MSEQRTRFDLRPEQCPRRGSTSCRTWSHEGIAPLPPLSPADEGAVGPGRSRAALPRVADHAGGLERPVDRHPRPRHRHLPLVEANAVVPCDTVGTGAQHARAHLFKYEGVSPAGSHKPNTAVPQAYYNKEAGIRRIATETGAGQWGSAMAMACSIFGFACTVYMVKASYEQKPYRRVFMETFGADVLASPSDTTNAGARSSASTPTPPGPSDRDQRGGRGCRHARGHELRARAACWDTCSCTSR